MRGTGVTVKDGGRGRCMLSTRMSALSWHSLWCGWVWCAQAVQWGDRSSMYAKGKEAHELCGTSITHSLARLSKMTLGSCAPTGPSGCTLAEWSHLPFQRAECDQFQDKMLRAEDCPETWNWLSLFFFCSSNLPGNSQKRDRKHKTVSSPRSGSTEWHTAANGSNVCAVLEEQQGISYQSNGYSRYCQQKDSAWKPVGPLFTLSYFTNHGVPRKPDTEQSR